MNLWLYKIIRTLGRPIYKLLYRPRIIGVENIPKKGGVILVGNHTSKLDAATIIGAPNRIVHTLSKKELFSSKLGNAFYRSMGCIKVNRNNNDDDAKNEAIDILNNGKCIGIFPEGTINKSNDIVLPFKFGAVSFAKKTGVPIIPFSITGEYKPFRKGLKVVFGKPIYIKDDLEEENKRLMNIISDMIIKGRKDEQNKNK